jgi:hypothetical protein
LVVFLVVLHVGLDGLTHFFEVLVVLGGAPFARITGNSFGKPAMIVKPVTIAVSVKNFRRPRLCITSSDVVVPSSRVIGETRRSFADANF